MALNDSPVGNGGFRCIPGFHKLSRIRKYREEYENGKFHPKSRTKIQPPTSKFVFFDDMESIDRDVKEISMNAGDYIIWNSRLPHSNCPNKSDKWRLFCYIRYVPINDFYSIYRKDVNESYNTGKKPRFFSTGLTSTGSVNAEWEIPLHVKPKLTWLGKRLLGVKEWK